MALVEILPRSDTFNGEVGGSSCCELPRWRFRAIVGLSILGVIKPNFLTRVYFYYFLDVKPFDFRKVSFELTSLNAWMENVHFREVSFELTSLSVLTLKKGKSKEGRWNQP